MEDLSGKIFMTTRNREEKTSLGLTCDRVVKDVEGK
jgi:hypothetical protein